MPTQSFGRLEKVAASARTTPEAAAACRGASFAGARLPGALRRGAPRQDGRFQASPRERESLDEILFEAFAAVREARVRESDQRMFDVQLMGGIVLHEGDIAEMKTGEGKTFVASWRCTERARRPRRAPRDRERLPRQARRGMEPWGLRPPRHHRRGDPEHDAVPRAPGRMRVDITYGTNSEFGLRLPARQHGRLTRRCRPARTRLAIVDEVDSS